MRFSHLSIFSIMCLLLVFASRATAARTVAVPTYQVNFSKDFSVAPTPAVDAPIGFMVIFRIAITNLSGVEQTGRVEMLEAGSLVDFAYARFGSGTSLKGMDFHYDICGNVSTGRVTRAEDIVATRSRHSLPEPAKFSVAANGYREITSAVYFYGQYGTSTSPKRFTLVNVGVKPTYRIVMNEDRGAVIGIVAVDIEAIGLTTGTYCSGVSILGAHAQGNRPPDNLAPPLLVNGGRPF